MKASMLLFFIDLVFAHLDELVSTNVNHCELSVANHLVHTGPRLSNLTGVFRLCYKVLIFNRLFHIDKVNKYF